MPSPERWRVWVAVVTASLALPFLLLDNANSAAGPEGTLPVEQGAPVLAMVSGASETIATLSQRAGSWVTSREELVAENLELAVQLAEQSRASLEAQIGQLAAEQRAAEEAALAEEAGRLAREEEERRRAEAAAAAAAAQRPPATTTTTAPPRPPAPAPRGEPTPEQWAALRSCESSGNYGAVSPTGRFRGAYQFSQATWDWVAGTAAPHLVGVDPSTAAPSDQDLMASTLHGMRGPGQWPTCGVHLSR